MVFQVIYKKKNCIFVVWWYVGNIESSGGHSEALAPQFFCEIRHKPTNHPGTQSNRLICGSSHSGPGFPASLPLTHIPRLAIMTVGAVYAKGIELLRFRTSRAMLLGMTWNERERKKTLSFWSRSLMQWKLLVFSYFVSLTLFHKYWFCFCKYIMENPTIL